MSATEVFESIARAGQKPHYAYALGNDRLSCLDLPEKWYPTLNSHRPQRYIPFFSGM